MNREEGTRRALRRRRVRAACAVAALAGFLAAVMGPVAPSTSAAAYDRFYANFEGEELMRAIAADRHALGLPALAASPVLAAAARDRAVTCPSNPGLTIRGRVRDMAERDYLSHDVKGCSDAQGGTFSGFDLLAATGVTWSTSGETIARTTYPATKTTYATGCNQSGGSCDGSIEVPWSVAVVARGWMSSSVHRPILTSTTFTRFGCAAWNASSGTHYYGCFFLSGSSAAIDGTGPSITDVTGNGGVFAEGSTPTFTATAADGGSLLAEGRATLDGIVIRNWAWDHAGSSAGISATAPPLTPGSHHVEWRVRDTSTNARTVGFDFTVLPSGSPGATPRSTPRPTPHPTAAPTPSPAPTRTPAPTAGRPSAPPVEPPPAGSTPPAGPGASLEPEGASAAPSAASAGVTAAPIGDASRSFPPGAVPPLGAAQLRSGAGDARDGLLPALALIALVALGWAVGRARGGAPP